MRKFKHIKTGIIVEQIWYEKTSYYPKHYQYQYKKSLTSCLETMIDPKFVEDCSDWQEIIKKDYEILSYKHVDGTITFMAQINEILKRGSLHEGYGIYQVKRLSDGE